MKSNLIFLAILLVFLGAGYFYYEKAIVPQPQEMITTKEQIQEKNKQLLAAQILAEKRPGVTSLIKGNLISSMADSLAEKASLPFLRYITETMDNLDIRLISLIPKDIVGMEDPNSFKLKEFIEIPYEMKVLASYEELGKFLDILEKSPRLIKISSFTVTNDIEQGVIAEEVAGKPRQHTVNLQINTIAILKASFRSESGEHN